MSTANLEIKTAIQILRPVHQVFEAIADPDEIAKYFIAESTGRLEEGKEVKWKFPEFDEKFPIRVVKIEEDKFISFYWKIQEKELLVEITLDAIREDATVVTITEKEMENNPAGIEWLKGNTEGWANFLACLKAYLEYGINLRMGAFDFKKV